MQRLARLAPLEMAWYEYSAVARYRPRVRSPIEATSNLWHELRHGVEHESRFFNTRLSALLDAAFAEVTHQPGRLDVAVQVIETSTPIYRARVALEPRDVESILEDPQARLGAPPPRQAHGGRMNAPGIRMFYGALDIDTCLAEVRPPVGSTVVVAPFDPIRPLRLLDLDLLADVDLHIDFFDPDLKAKTERHLFLRSLAYRLTRPVMPGGEELDYVLTQVICEYIAQVAMPALDGIAFASAQRSSRGRNIALFARSGGVSGSPLPPEATRIVRTEFDSDSNAVGFRITDRFADDAMWPRFISLDESELTRPSPRQSATTPPAALCLDVEKIVMLRVETVSYAHRVLRLDIEQSFPRDDLPF